MAGTVPAWRPFQPGMSDGQDVQESSANLISLGDASGLLSTAGPHFGAAPTPRSSVGRSPPASGTRVRSTLASSPSCPARCWWAQSRWRRASAPHRETRRTGDREGTVVSVPLNPNHPGRHRRSGGLDDPAHPAPSTPGRSPRSSPAPAARGSASSSSSGLGSSGATAMALVTPDDPAATGSAAGRGGTGVADHPIGDHVLAVPSPHCWLWPVAAMASRSSARRGAPPRRRDHWSLRWLEVQVFGTGLQPGTKVVVAQ